MSPCGLVIDSRPPADLLIAALADLRRWKMNAIEKISNTDRYARCVETSKRVRWDIDKDVIRGRRFDVAHKLLADGLSLADTSPTCRPTKSGS
jgi:hypothetical protein